MGEKHLPPIDFFEQQTTQRNDYRWPKDVKRELVSWKKEREETPPKQPPQLTFTDVETLVPFLPGIHVPFNLHWRRKPILQTHPKEGFEFKLNQELPKVDENIRFTRPRVYKAPEISIDDIPDKKTRDMIIEYTYLSTWRNDSKNTDVKTTQRRIPTTTWQSPVDDNVNFKMDSNSTKTEQEWGRKYGKVWDKLQTCYTVDPDKTFWQEKYKEDCEKKLPTSVPHELIDHIIKLGKKEKLRMPYMIHTPGYTGFIPKAPFNIKPEKKNLTPFDVRLTLNEAVESLKSGKLAEIKEC